MAKAANSLKMAVAAAGTQAKLAKLLGRSQQVVSLWYRSGKKLSAEDALLVERAYRIPRHVLRPDLFGSPADASQ